MSLKTKILNLFRAVFKIPFLEQWLRKKTQGNSTSTFWCKLVPNNYQYPSGSTRKFIYQSSITLHVDVHDYVGHYLYFGFKDEGQEKLLQLINPGNIILDIGTNIGATLLQMADKAGQNGFVYGFEPDAFNYKAALKNIQLNNLPNVSVENIGLGNEKGTFKLFIDTESNRGGNRIKTDKTLDDTNYTEIQVERLDDWVINKSLTKIDLIKIDVEGFETNVIKGGLKTIKKHLPTLFIEVDDNNLKAVGSSAQELIILLEKLGYRLTNAQNETTVTSDTNFSNCHFDVIATKQSTN